MPTLRRFSQIANGRVSGSRAIVCVSALTWRSSGAPRCGVPSPTMCRNAFDHTSSRSAARWAADRTTRPPIECPTSAISVTGTGHLSTSVSRYPASRRPLSEMRSPVL